MNKKNIILIVLLVLVIIFAIVGIVLGIAVYRNNDNNVFKSQSETYSLTLEDMYCNVNDSKRILKVKVTIETDDEKALEVLDRKRFLIRDDINKIIRDKTEEDLNGTDGQVKLQDEIEESLIDLFNDEIISNIYFNDFIMQ
ncbi:flagellar basal body-associated FliL family protein [Schnuerera sp. xch1]|uniref:flagellar basal body-associated FliL family protein n=1 Tax=Schnuerera sp. xch1 TaxID=2874283 RepID=UPI001CBD4B49|nr:flagellar basal body-associated FliL family protein [Schnuerera sp. xch1]MBZ2173866.1 flagellar basal body-associated FliL family protein [Schnuerera sp. xch1]